MRSDVLVITDRKFWRRSIGSEQRVAALIEYIAQRGDSIHVAYLGRTDAQEESRIAAFTRPLPGLEIETRSLLHSIRSAIPALRARGRAPSEFAQFGGGSPARRNFVESVLRARRPHIVIVSLLRLIQTVHPRPEGLDADTQFIVDTHDLIHQRAARYRAAGASVAREMRAEDEMRALQTFDAILSIQHKEGNAIREALPASNVLVIPHGIEMPRLSAETTPESLNTPIRLGFLGGRDEANRAALDWFIDAVWPTLKSRFGQKVELHVAGQVCREWQSEAPGVKSIGSLDRIEDFWPRIDIAINPVRFGSGLKIKNVEALAFARPLLTTSVGAEGLEGAGTSGIAIEDEADGWLRRLTEWIESPELRARRGAAGRAFAEVELSKEAAFRPLGRLLDRIASVRAAGPARTRPDSPAHALREQILVLSSQHAFESLAGPVPDEMNDRFIFLKPDQEKAIRDCLPTTRLVISKNYPRPDVNRWILAARTEGVPTILLVDGPLEWANIHSNPSLARAGAEAARSLFVPIIHDAVASIGPAQSRWIESQNSGRGLLHFQYANRRIRTELLPERACEFDFLLTTAKTAAFSGEDRNRLGNALELCARALRPYGARILVRFFDTSLEERVRRILPTARFETKGPFSAALARTACVIGTPSSVLLEAMLHNKPTANLLFRSHPLFYETGWEIDPENLAPDIFADMLNRNETGLRLQAESLKENLSDCDFYVEGLAGPVVQALTAARPLDDLDLEFGRHVRTWEKQHEARLATRIRRFTFGHSSLGSGSEP